VKSIKIDEAASRDLAELYASDDRAAEDLETALECLSEARPLPSAFRDHPMVGELHGWRAFEIGDGARVVYFSSRVRVSILAAGPHNLAYDRAKLRKIERAGRVSRRRQKARRRE
jgi:addiction module RelE/StbE family toxin